MGTFIIDAQEEGYQALTLHRPRYHPHGYSIYAPRCIYAFDPIYIPPLERQGLKSTDWTQRSIDRVTSNFSDIGEKWKNKVRIEIRKNLQWILDYEDNCYDGHDTMFMPAHVKALAGVVKEIIVTVPYAQDAVSLLLPCNP